MAWLCLTVIRFFHLRLNNDAVCSLKLQPWHSPGASEGVTKLVIQDRS